MTRSLLCPLVRTFDYFRTTMQTTYVVSKFCRLRFVLSPQYEATIFLQVQQAQPQYVVPVQQEVIGTTLSSEVR